MHNSPVPLGDPEAESFLLKETLEPAHYGSRRDKRCSHTLIIIFVSLTVTSLALFGIAFSADWGENQPWHDHHQEKTEGCGSTVEEARAKGCLFDPMSFTWSPPKCHDQGLIDEFLHLKDWTWYIHYNGTEPAPRENVLAGKHDHLYVSWEYHKYHCTYSWRKLHRAVLRDGWVDSYIGSYNHTAHCEAMLVKYDDGNDHVNTVIRTKFVSCGRMV